MTWVVTEMASLDTTADAATYTVPTFTPVANRLYLLVGFVVRTAGGASLGTTAATFNGTGLAWTNVGGSDTGHTSYRMRVYRALATSGLAAGDTTLALGGLTHDGGYAKVYEVYEDADGVPTTGTQGSDAVGSTVANSFASSASRSITIPAFGGVGSMTIAFWLGRAGNVGPCTAEGSYTELFDQNNLGGGGYGLSHHVYGQWLASDDTTPSNTATNAAAFAAVGLEVKKNAPAGGGIPVRSNIYRQMRA